MRANTSVRSFSASTAFVKKIKMNTGLRVTARGVHTHVNDVTMEVECHEKSVEGNTVPFLQLPHSSREPTMSSVRVYPLARASIFDVRCCLVLLLIIGC